MRHQSTATCSTIAALWETLQKETNGEKGVRLPPRLEGQLRNTGAVVREAAGRLRKAMKQEQEGLGRKVRSQEEELAGVEKMRAREEVARKLVE